MPNPPINLNPQALHPQGAPQIALHPQQIQQMLKQNNVTLEKYVRIEVGQA